MAVRRRRRLNYRPKPLISLVSDGGRGRGEPCVDATPNYDGHCDRLLTDISAPQESYRISAITRFALLHIACFAAIWTGVHAADLIIAAVLYAVRMFGITAGYHRYFSHKSFKTSRPFAFVLAVLAQTSAQTGIIWWAAKHRDHHRYSDTEADVHSPVIRRFWYAHIGWIFTKEHAETDYDAAPDLAKYPELVWLDRHPYLPAAVLGFLVFLLAGWSGLIVGFLWSTVALWHSTFAINSVAHVVGRRRYLTGDQSRNSWWLALLTFGEGWHNNHHHYQSSARQGFRWYEIDLTYYALRALASVGLVWDLRQPPQSVVRNERRLNRVTIEKAARQLAESYRIETIAADLGYAVRSRIESLHATPHDAQAQFDALVLRLREKADGRIESLRTELNGFVSEFRLNALPSRHDITARAAEMFVPAPSLETIADRARQILEETVASKLIESVPAGFGRPA